MTHRVWARPQVLLPSIHKEAYDRPDRLRIQTPIQTTKRTEALQSSVGLPRRDGAPADWLIPRVSQYTNGHAAAGQAFQVGSTGVLGRSLER